MGIFDKYKSYNNNKNELNKKGGNPYIRININIKNDSLDRNAERHKRAGQLFNKRQSAFIEFTLD